MNLDKNENYENVRYLSHLGDNEKWVGDQGHVYRSNYDTKSPLEVVLQDIIKIVKSDTKADVLDLYILKDKVNHQVDKWLLVNPRIQDVANKSLRSDRNQILEDVQNDFLTATYEKLEEKLFSNFELSFPSQNKSSENREKREVIDAFCRALAAKHPCDALAKAEKILQEVNHDQVRVWLEHMDELGYPGAVLMLARHAQNEEKKREAYLQAAKEGNLDLLYQLALNETNPVLQLARLSELADLSHAESIELFGLIKVDQALDLFSEASKKDSDKEMLLSMAYAKLQDAIEKGYHVASLIKANKILEFGKGDETRRNEAKQIYEDIVLLGNEEMAANAHVQLGKMALNEGNANLCQGEINDEFIKEAARHFALAANLGAYGPLPDYVLASKDVENACELYGFCMQTVTGELKEGRYVSLESYIDMKLSESITFADVIQDMLQNERNLIIQDIKEGYVMNPQTFQTLIKKLLSTKAIDNKTHKYFHPLNHEIISSGGLRIIIEEINKNKHYFENMPCVVCENLTEAQEMMTEALMDLSQMPEGGKRGFLMLNQGGHVVPIYIQKTKMGQFTILDTDTAFAMFGNILFVAIVHSLKKAQILPDQVSIVLLFDENIARQHDSISCPIFSLRDLVQLAKNDSVMDFVHSQNKIPFKQSFMEDYKFYQFESTPPQMLNTTQSLSTLNDYDIEMAEKTDGHISIVEKLQESGKIAETDDESVINAKVYLLHVKYRDLILRKALTNLKEQEKF